MKSISSMGTASSSPSPPQSRTSGTPTTPRAASWAAAAGYLLDVKATPPASPERNLYAFADFQAWLQAQNNVGLARNAPVTPATKPGVGAFLVVLVVAGVIVGVIYGE